MWFVGILFFQWKSAKPHRPNYILMGLKLFCPFFTVNFYKFRGFFRMKLDLLAQLNTSRWRALPLRTLIIWYSKVKYGVDKPRCGGQAGWAAVCGWHSCGQMCVLFSVLWMTQLVIGIHQLKLMDACRKWIFVVFFFLIFISMSSVFRSTGVCFLNGASQCWLWLKHTCRKGWKHRSPCCRKKV